MNQSETFCLKWTDFQENVYKVFSDIRKKDDFADVTFVCEDEKQVVAHKVILGVLSPFFKNIFTKNKHAHPLIYMRGTKSDDLVAILDFVYNGQANVEKQNLETFLALGDELKLKGLTGYPKTTSEDVPGVLEKEITNKSNFQVGDGEDSYQGKYEVEELINTNDLINIGEIGERTAAVSDDFKLTNFDILTQNLPFGNSNECEFCNKKFHDRANRIRHIKNNHENRKFACRFCSKTFNDVSNMNRHIGSTHTMKSKVFNCQFCHKVFNQYSNMNSHIKRNHSDIF